MDAGARTTVAEHQEVRLIKGLLSDTKRENMPNRPLECSALRDERCAYAL